MSKNMKCWNLVNLETDEILVRNLTKAEAMAKEEKAHDLGIPAMAMNNDDLELCFNMEEAI